VDCGGLPGVTRHARPQSYPSTVEPPVVTVDFERRS
jgi:hypothetical protein